MLEGSTIAAILTGILALVGALATAWMSGWNEKRNLSRANRKALARYSVPLLIASWDLANWFYDILDEGNYNPHRCKVYGDGWNSKFTSYLLGQYFVGVHIIREMTHFFGHIRDGRAVELKKLLWKIHDEFISMHYEGRESLEMRWFEGDILATQERMTITCDMDGDGVKGEMRPMGWVEFQENYFSGSGSKNNKNKGLKSLFEWYEDDFQRVIYRRFKYLYSTVWSDQENPQSFEKMQENLSEEEMKRIIKEEKHIEDERKQDPNCGIAIPDHRIRRLQHLLSDLVELLDEVSKMKFNRPVRRCSMLVENRVLASGNPLGIEVGPRIPCDCHDLECNREQEEFEHRQLSVKRGWKNHSKKGNMFRSKRQNTDSMLKRETTSGSKC